jgi:hypothetical protein
MNNLPAISGIAGIVVGGCSFAYTNKQIKDQREMIDKHFMIQEKQIAELQHAVKYLMESQQSYGHLSERKTFRSTEHLPSRTVREGEEQRHKRSESPAPRIIREEERRRIVRDQSPLPLSPSPRIALLSSSRGDEEMNDDDLIDMIAARAAVQ